MHIDAINIHPTRVRSHQTDLNDVMYHGAYFDIFDDARIETFRALGYTFDEFKREGCMLVIRRVECDYRASARLDDLLTVRVCIEKFTPATMIAHYLCRRNEDVIAVGRTTYAFLDARGRPTRVPARVRTLVESRPELWTSREN